MAKRILNDEQFFSSVHTQGFSHPVKLMNEQGLGELVGSKADVHLHTPATKKLGKPIYSVLVGGLVQGHTEDIFLKDTKMKVDKKQLEIYLANPSKGKTRNTFVSGTVHPAPLEPAERTLKVRPGLMEDEETGEDVSMGMSGVRLSSENNKPSAKYKR